MPESMAGSTSSTDAPSAHGPAAMDAAEFVRCRKCSHRLMKITSGALRHRAALEIKCNSCKTLNYLIGTHDAE